MEETPLYRCPETVIILFGSAYLHCPCPTECIPDFRVKEAQCAMIYTFSCSAAVETEHVGTKAIATLENDCPWVGNCSIQRLCCEATGNRHFWVSDPRIPYWRLLCDPFGNIDWLIRPQIILIVIKDFLFCSLPFPPTESHFLAL